MFLWDSVDTFLYFVQCAPVNETLLDALRYQTCLRAQNYST